jgi:hypothetical protein
MIAFILISMARAPDLVAGGTVEKVRVDEAAKQVRTILIFSSLLASLFFSSF